MSNQCKPNISRSRSRSRGGTGGIASRLEVAQTHPHSGAACDGHTPLPRRAWVSSVLCHSLRNGHDLNGLPHRFAAWCRTVSCRVIAIPPTILSFETRSSKRGKADARLSRSKGKPFARFRCTNGGCPTFSQGWNLGRRKRASSEPFAGRLNRSAVQCWHVGLLTVAFPKGIP